MTNPYDHYNALRSRISEKEAELTQLRTEAENEALRVFGELYFKEGDVVEYRSYVENDTYRFLVSEIAPFWGDALMFSVLVNMQLKGHSKFGKRQRRMAFFTDSEQPERFTIISRAE